MTYRVTISAQAEADLRGIYEYIAFKLRSTINAAGQLDRLERAISGLDTIPERYAAYSKGKWTERGLSVCRWTIISFTTSRIGTL